MKKKVVWRNVVLAVLFTLVGVTQFSENVRAVQVVGLFFSGVVVGAMVTVAIFMYKASPESKQ